MTTQANRQKLVPDPKGERTVRVATYTRISTDEAHQPYSLDAQEQRLGAYMASQEGWEHTASFTDQLSGATLERPGIRRALAQARAGRFDILLVYRTDRLSRSVRGLAQVIEDLDTAGVAFRSATEPFDTQAAAGRMMVQMLGVFAEFERGTIIDRVIAGMERKAALGGWCGGHVPLGYRAVKGEGRLEVDLSEAPLVALIFDRYVRERMGSPGSRVREAIATGSPAIVKELLGTLIHEIRVESRHAIQPVFRVPEGTRGGRAVRAPSRSVEVSGLKPPTSALHPASK